MCNEDGPLKLNNILGGTTEHERVFKFLGIDKDACACADFDGEPCDFCEMRVAVVDLLKHWGLPKRVAPPTPGKDVLALEFLETFTDYFEGNCRLDHHGVCQEHLMEDVTVEGCTVQRARAWIEIATTQPPY